MPRSARPNINWYENKVRVEVDRITRRGLLAIAHQIEGQTKVNITDNGQVETGFLRNSVYVTGLGESSYGQANQSGEYTSQKSGDVVERELAPEISNDDKSVAIVAGANYAIYQEMEDSFLFRALEQVVGQVAEARIVEAAR